jgi:predicted DNA-binding transcriptional regulator AlpA
MSIHSCGRDDRLIVDGRDASDDAVDIYEVMRLLGVSESSIWRGVRGKRLPQPFYPQPRAARWVRAEVIRTRELLRMSPRDAMRARLKKSPVEPIAG